MKRKILALLLTCIIVINFTFMACTTSEESEEPTKVTTISRNGNDIVSEEFLESLKGMEVEITYPWAVASPGSSPAADRTLANIQKIKDEYGVTVIQTSGRANYHTVMTTSIMSGSPMGNILMCQERFTADWFRAGVFSDLTQAAEDVGIDFTDPEFNQFVRKYANLNGQQVGFAYGNSVGSSIYYNKRIFEEQGMDDPHDLFENGEWTWDALESLTRQGTIRNPDGTVEVWGLGAWMVYDLLIYAAQSNNASIVRLNEENMLELNLNDPKTMEALEFIYKMSVTDNVANPNHSDRWDKPMYDFTNGDYAMMLGTDYLLTAAFESGMQDEFGVIVFPKGPSATIDMQADVTTLATFYFIPKTYQSDAAKYLFVLDQLIRGFREITWEEAFEETYSIRIFDERSYDMYKGRRFNPERFDLTNLAGIIWTDPSVSTLGLQIASGTSTPVTAVEVLGSMLQSTIDDIWEDIVITGEE